MRLGRRSRSAALSRYWNALEQGAPAWELERLSDGLDPAVVETVLRLKANDDARMPDPAFVDRLEEVVMSSTAVSPFRPTSGAASIVSPREPRRAPPAPKALRPRRISGRWAMTHLATAALLLLTMAGVAVTYLAVNDRGGQEPGGVPALLASPEATPEIAMPPEQPATGPGGADYRFENVIATNFGGGGREAAGYWLFEPEGAGEEALPVVIFLHDQGEGQSPDSYRAWIDHLVRRGAIVIYPSQRAMAGQTPPEEINANVQAAVTATLAALERDEHAAADVTRLAVVGHGGGATAAIDYAAGAAAAGLPAPGAVLAVFPSGDALADPSTIPVTTLVVVVAGTGDLLVDDPARRLWAAFGPNPDPATRVYLEMKGDAHGEPALAVDHYAPMANEFGGPQIVNALDWYGTWKWLDALMGCAFAGEWCEYVVGDTPEQRFMGTWSDGTPVVEAVVGPPAAPAGTPAST